MSKGPSWEAGALIEDRRSIGSDFCKGGTVPRITLGELRSQRRHEVFKRRCTLPPTALVEEERRDESLLAIERLCHTLGDRCRARARRPSKPDNPRSLLDLLVGARGQH